MQKTSRTDAEKTKAFTNQLSLPKLFGNGCVLLQGKNTKIWGTAAPGETVTAEIQDQKVSGQAGEHGNWEMVFPELKAGGPFVLTVVTARGEIIKRMDVYVGEVYLCAGQSNMELPMNRVKDKYPEELNREKEPLIRLFKVKEHYNFHKPEEDYKEGKWTICAPESIGEFSAVSYFLGRFLFEAREVPIGILNISLGGSPIQAWMGKESLLSFPKDMETLKRYQSNDFVRFQLTENERKQKEWYDWINREDCGMSGEDSNWKEINLPALLSEEGFQGFCGSIWFRKRINVSETMAKKGADLWLGTMVDHDQTYVNGVLVGETTYQYPPRKYKVPSEVLKAGDNIITIRLIVSQGEGRITPGKTYSLFDKEEQISLNGNWEYKIGCQVGPEPETDFIIRKPTGLYNGMAAPSKNYSVAGILWYQGESNDEEPETYKELLKRMIQFWRKERKQPDLPFVVAQLPNFSIDLKEKKDAWPMIREAQKDAERLSNVAVTVNLDLGESNDLHPLNKKEVARRMSLAVRGMIHEEDLVYQGPELISWVVEKNCVTLNFHTYDEKPLLVKYGTGFEAFELAGADGIFYRVEGTRKENQITVWCQTIEKPEFLRYAYQNAPEAGLLCNQSGLLASPFRICLNKN
ncbi:sialate O-acetylesterase [Clostridium sp. E02]|uniref:sialate O-acetylesterase n=1 Tax=Clostridium sp. E02 TaxID=2487134 RepID=UPI000F548FC0|nr:sialate O-acetylesterase [Clostridium sp. E02]